MMEDLEKLIHLPQRGEYMEIRLEKIFSTTIRVQNGMVEKIRMGTDEGGYVRLLTPRGSWWFESFQRWEGLREKVERAINGVSLLPSSGIEVVRRAPVQSEEKVALADDFRFKSLEDKTSLLLEYNRILKEISPLLVSSLVEYRDEFRQIYLANSDGSLIYWEKPDIGLNFIATARRGDNIEMYRDGVAGKAGFELVKNRENLAQEVGQKALLLLEAPSFPGGVYDVVLDPVLAGVFIHEAFGHLSESDTLYRNEELKKIMTKGKRVASPVLNVFDDGNLDNLRGSSPYDDEGIPTGRTYLIRDGYLSGRLHSRETACLMQEEVTGNARTIGYRFPPIVRMTNTAIEGGETTREDLFSDIERGLYAVEYIGGNTALELFTFSAAYGYLIEKGKIKEMVKDVVLSGNLFQTLDKIDAVANDFRWTEVGGCGKGGQMGLPTPTGSPHVRLREVLVGGSHND
ncbi:MAG TPA: TldD/PmbA family protein [Candidatus Atribacteria bacterium]|nr:TldD/PmbA family protein [Candidatus Atribacteria bacterium]